MNKAGNWDLTAKIESSRWSLSYLVARFQGNRSPAIVASLAWAGLAQAVGLVIRLASNLILARLLAPELYGVFGTALAVLTTLDWISDIGIVPGLLRHPQGREPHYLQTGWWMGVARGSLLTLAAVSCAWPLAWIYDKPILVSILCVLALRPLLLSLRSPDLPKLRADMNYRALFWDEICQTFGGTLVSLTLAWITGSIWSIVFGSIAGALCGIVVSYILCPCRPRWVWNSQAFHELRGFSSQVFFNTLVMAVLLNSDRLLGGGWLSDHDMGLYIVAFNLAATIEGLLIRGCDVYYSYLARRGTNLDAVDQQSEVLRIAVRKACPLITLGIAVAPWAVWILYDHRYSNAAPLFAVLVSRLMIRGYSQLQFQGLLASARIKAATCAYMIALVVQVIAIFALIQFSALGLALASWLSAAILAIAQTWLSSKSCSQRLLVFLVIFWASLGLLVAILWN